MGPRQKKEVVDSLRERPDNVSSRFEEFGLRQPETLTDEEAAKLNRQFEAGQGRLHADD